MSSIPEKPTKPLRVSARFPDVSALGDAVGFELGFRQLDKNDPAIPATVLSGKNVILTNTRFACSFHQLGLPPIKMLTFGVPIVGLRDWYGREYRASSILPFSHPDGIDGVSESGFESFTISFSEDYMADITSSYQITAPNYLHQPTPESRIERSESNDHFRSLLKRIFSDPNSEFGQDEEDELVVALLNAAQNGSANIDRSSARLRARALEQALAYIEKHQGEVVSIRKVCKDNDIALRTLNRAFNERFGIGPTAYLKRRRLSAVRVELLRSPPGTVVTDIANRWGFWHLGQFANDYRTLFGELPSQTLNK